MRAKPKGDDEAPVVVEVGLFDVAVEEIDTAGPAASLFFERRAPRART